MRTCVLQVVRASVLTFPLRASFFLILRAAVELNEQGNLRLNAQDRGVRDPHAAQQSQSQSQPGSQPSQPVVGKQRLRATLQPPQPEQQQETKEPQEQQQSPQWLQQGVQPQQKQEVQQLQQQLQQGMHLQPPFIAEVASIWEQEKRRKALLRLQQQQQKQQQKQRPGQQLLQKQQLQALGTDSMALKIEEPQQEWPMGPQGTTHATHHHLLPADCDGHSGVMEACLVSLRRLGMDEAPLLRGLGHSRSTAGAP